MISNINKIQDTKNLSSPQTLTPSLSTYDAICLNSPNDTTNNIASESITVYNKGLFVAFLS